MPPPRRRVSEAFHLDNDRAPFASGRRLGSVRAKMAGSRFDAKVLHRALRRIGLQTDRKDGGNHGITAVGPSVPPSAVQIVAEAT